MYPVFLYFPFFFFLSLSSLCPYFDLGFRRFESFLRFFKITSLLCSKELIHYLFDQLWADHVNFGKKLIVYPGSYCIDYNLHVCYFNLFYCQLMEMVCRKLYNHTYRRNLGVQSPRCNDQNSILRISITQCVCICASEITDFGVVSNNFLVRCWW